MSGPTGQTEATISKRRYMCYLLVELEINEFFEMSFWFSGPLIWINSLACEEQTVPAMPRVPL